MGDDKKNRPGENLFNLTLEKIETFSSAFLTILLLGLTLLLGASIALRYFMGQPIAWSNSVARYIYIYIVLIGSAISYMQGGHATIESFYEIMPGRIRKIFDIAHYLIIMGLSGILVVNGTKYALSMWGVHSPVMMSFSMGIVYLAVPISFAITFLYLLKETIFPGRQ